MPVGVSTPPRPAPQARFRDLDLQLDQLAAEIAASFPGQAKIKLALLDFPNLDGKVSDLGRYLTEELTTRLFRTGRFQLVERQLLKKVLEEQKLGASGLLDENAASRLGRLLGVEALTAGTVADLGPTVKINARVITVETGSLASVATVSLAGTGEVARLLGRKPEDGTQTQSGRFDGTWDVTVGCPPSGRGAGYSSQFSGVVKNGVLHAQYGVEGMPSSMTLDGRINPDGSAAFLAYGLTGDPRTTVNNSRRGSPFSYHVEATFQPTSGTGRRLELRPCTLTFLKR